MGDYDREEGSWHSETYQSLDGTHCPSCGSPEPRVHPATGDGGEVTRVCSDPFHASVRLATPDRRLTDVLRLMQHEVGLLNAEKGWRDRDTSFAEYIALLHSEVSEALDAYRVWKLRRNKTPEGKPDDVRSELADVFIRLLDMCDLYGIDLAREFRRKMDYNWTRPHLHGGKVL